VILRGLLLLMGMAATVTAAPPVVVQITHDGLLKQRPAWSPDGRHVVFARHKGSEILLFVRDMTTGKEERLTKTNGPEYDAVFAPDGKSLLFTFDKVSPNQGDIDVHRFSWQERTPMPAAISRKALSHEESPTWSPDGKRFAFTSTYQGNQEVYAASLDGDEWTRLTEDVATDAHPAWSPDGKTIAFSTSRWGNFEIALMDSDGGNLRRFTTSVGMDDYSGWSPDGNWLAWTSNRDGNLEIYVQDAAAKDPPRNITQNPAIDNFPTWTPDGRLGFVSDRGDGFDLYVTAEPLR
jgi:TolB protein